MNDWTPYLIATLLLVADSAVLAASVIEARVDAPDAKTHSAPWHGGTVRGQGYLATVVGAVCGAAVGFNVGPVVGFGVSGAATLAYYHAWPGPPDDRVMELLFFVLLFVSLASAFVFGIAGLALGCAAALHQRGHAGARRTAATALKALALALVVVGLPLIALGANDTTQPFTTAVFDHDIVALVGVPAMVGVSALVARRLALRAP